MGNLNTKGLYSEDNHFKSINEYFFMGNIIEFVSLDEPQKIRGRKRDVLFINEGNELNWEDFCAFINLASIWDGY